MLLPPAAHQDMNIGQLPAMNGCDHFCKQLFIIITVTFVRQLRNSRLQRYRRFLKGVPALNDKRSVRGSYRLICQVGLNDNEIDFGL